MLNKVDGYISIDCVQKKYFFCDVFFVLIKKKEWFYNWFFLKILFMCYTGSLTNCNVFLHLKMNQFDFSQQETLITFIV